MADFSGFINRICRLRRQDGRRHEDPPSSNPKDYTYVVLGVFIDLDGSLKLALVTMATGDTNVLEFSKVEFML